MKRILGSLIIGELILLMLLSFDITLAVSPWTPNTEDAPPGYEHFQGTTYTAKQDPLYTGIKQLRIDFWHKKDTDIMVMTITIVNGTGVNNASNIFNQPAPSSLVSSIEAFTKNYESIIHVKKINTLWDLLTEGLQGVNIIVRYEAMLTKSEVFSSSFMYREDYPYLDTGFLFYSNITTLGYAKDIDLAIIAIDCSYSNITSNSLSIQEDGDALIERMNQIVSGIFHIAEVFTSSIPSADEQPQPALTTYDKEVPYVLNYISFQYGANYHGRPISAYIPWTLYLIGALSLAAIVSKTKIGMKQNQ